MVLLPQGVCCESFWLKVFLRLAGHGLCGRLTCTALSGPLAVFCLHSAQKDCAQGLYVLGAM